MADAQGSGPCERNFMQVQVLSSAPNQKARMGFFYFLKNLCPLFYITLPCLFIVFIIKKL